VPLRDTPGAQQAELSLYMLEFNAGNHFSHVPIGLEVFNQDRIKLMGDYEV
jgi:hypothetical protein